MWSVGVIMYTLLGGYAPFEGPNMNLDICDGYYCFHDQYWSNVSQQAKDMISSILRMDPSHRITAREALECDWLKGQQLKSRITTMAAAR